MKDIFLISGIRFTYKFVIQILKEDKKIFLEFLKYWPSSHGFNIQFEWRTTTILLVCRLD